MNFFSYINHDKIYKEREKNTSSWILIDESGHYPTVWGKSIRIKKLIYIHWHKFEFWFRLDNGYGLEAKNIKFTFLKFSGRIGKKKSITIFNWRFSILKPYHIK